VLLLTVFCKAALVTQLNVIAELERMGWKYECISENELKAICPFHSDSNPSCSINIVKHLFKCHTSGCGKQGDFITFLAGALKTPRYVVLEDINRRYGITQDKVVNISVIEQHHSAIWAAQPFLKELRDRGVGPDQIRQYRLGYSDGRITIPVMNASGHYVNIRKYLPSGPSNDKMRNLRGRGKIRLFPIEQLSYGTIIICGGELKAIVAAMLLNKHDIGAISTTAGEGNWDAKFTPFFKNKRVYVLFDIDKEGSKSADLLCTLLRLATDWIGKCLLPLDIDVYPHGDVNDWIGLEKATDQDFLNLLAKTSEWELQQQSYETNELPVMVSLTQSVNAVNTGKRLVVKAIVSAMDTNPYVVPKLVEVQCGRDQPMCSICPIMQMSPDENDKTYCTIPAESPGILSMIATPKSAQRDALIESVQIPFCKTVVFIPQSYYNAEDVRLGPQLEITNDSSEKTMQPAVCLGTGLELNESYEFVGRMYPHPKTQQSILLISSYKLTKDALSSYKPRHSDELKIFQPKQWTPKSLEERLAHIYNDFENNVTRIFKRYTMHLMIDLAYHSPLLFSFDHQVVKGWVEILIIGDSSQGKSETSRQLMAHYGLGEKVECKNATVAGLLGGLQQMGNRWFVSWGIIPTHDRRLIFLEELKGASVEVIAKLTDMRSSGIAEIPKIEKRRTHARTRLVALSNPRSDMPVASYSYGIQTIKELIGGLEDIRRFDAALVLSSEEINADELSNLQRSSHNTKHTYTAELCRRLILWAWTRTVEEVIFSGEAKEEILDSSTRLCTIFSEVLPLVDRGSMRFKIARLSSALACRTYSCEGEKVLIRKCHVQYIEQFLQRIYSSETFGYLDYSNALKSAEVLKDPNLIKLQLLQTPFPKDLLEQLLHTDRIEFRDIGDWCGWDKGETLQFISLLVRKHAFQRVSRHYRKTPAFIHLLKNLLESDDLKKFDRPMHIKEDF